MNSKINIDSLKNSNNNNWNFFYPDAKKVYAIHTFDDGNENYKKYNNEWFVVGEWQEKVALLNKEKNIFVNSISLWKLTLIDYKYTVETMIRSHNLFTTIPDECKNDEFKVIEKGVQDYIKKYCRHHIVHDYIDLDPDKGKHIKYCDICYTDFSEC